MSEDGYHTATDLASDIRRGNISAVAVIESYLERINTRNTDTTAYVNVLAEHAQNRALEIDEMIAAGDDPGPLAGVPVAIKDLCPIEGVETTFGSVPFRRHVADTDAILVERLRSAGAILIGKTNTPEFGHKGTTDNNLFGPTTTPYHPERNAGGSTGGGAAAVADGLAPLAQGGDGGGSIRIPAACCNVFGFKPSFGRVPHATRPDAFSEHTPFINRGPLSRTVGDAALMLDVITGSDDRDPFSLPGQVDYQAAANRGARTDLDDLTIAYSANLGLFPVQDAVRTVVEEAAMEFKKTGAEVKQVDPEFERSREQLFSAWHIGYEVLNAHLATMMEDQYDVDFLGADRDVVSDAFAELVVSGRSRTALELRQADRIRTDIYDTIRVFLTKYDLLVTPTLAITHLEQEDTNTLGPSRIEGENVDPLVGWAMTWPFNLTGNPVGNVPAGFADERTPVGMQLIGPRHGDELVMRASAAFERVRPWYDGYPPARR